MRPRSALTTLRRMPVSSVSCAAFHWPSLRLHVEQRMHDPRRLRLQREGALGIVERLRLVAVAQRLGDQAAQAEEGHLLVLEHRLEGAVGAVAVAVELGGLRRQQQRERRLGEQLLGLARRGAAPRRRRRPPPRRGPASARDSRAAAGSRPSLRAARPARRRSSDRAASSATPSRIRKTTATSSTPTLVSSRQPRHSTVTLPGRSASHTAPSIATAAMANQISVRSKVMRITARCPAARPPARRAGRPRAGRRDAPRHGPASRRWRARSAAAATSPARRPWQDRRPGSPLRRARAWPRPNRPGTSAPMRRSETRPFSLPSSRCQKESSARSSASAALAIAGNDAARLAREATPFAAMGCSGAISSPSLASPCASGVSRPRSVAKGWPAVRPR